MKEQEFKRKRKPSPRHADSATAPHAAPTDALKSSRLGMPYQSGPLYNLASLYFEQGEDEVLFKDVDAIANRLENPGMGDSLEKNQRQAMERRFGRDFSQVRVHQGPIANTVTQVLGAKAFTYRQHIWLGAQAHTSDVRLMAHELTHVAQQGYAPARSHRGPIALSPAPRSVPVAEASAIEPGKASQASAAAGTRAASGHAAPGAVQRIDLWDAAVDIGGSVVSSVGNAVDFVTDIPGNLASMALSELRPIVRRIAPTFYEFFANGGVSGFLNRMVQRGIRSLFTGVMESMRNVVTLDNLSQGFDQARDWLSAVTEQFSADACDAILTAACRVKEFFSDTFGPVVDKISGVACEVKTFFSGIWDAIGAPIWDFLRNIGGEIWEELQGYIRQAGRLIREARDALGSAWDTVKEWLGIEAEEGTSEGGGIWSWIREQLSEIGDSIAEFVRPIMGPLRDAGGVLLMFIPGGQIFAVMALWPRLRQAFDWISQTWDDLCLIPRARAFLTETVFPAMMDIAEAIGQAMLSQAEWLVTTLGRFVGIVTSVVDMIPTALMPMRPVISFALGIFQEILGFARTGIRYVARNFRSLLRRLLDFLGIVWQGLIHIISIVLNPFGIVGFLMGTIWRLIPDCLKGPFIDFILGTIIRFLRLMPPMPMLGILWPLVKHAMLGFMETVMDLELVRKVDISNKIAIIISGMSPTFIFGFFRGIVLGLWEAITSPITAVAMVFELPTMIQEFLDNLGVRLCELIDQIRCFANELSSRVFGSLDSVLSAIGEFLEEPGRVIELIRCAIEGILSGARELGSQAATRLIELFEGPDDNIGEGLGRVASFFLVQAVVTFFTAGAGTAVTSGLGIVRQIATALRTLGRAIREVVRVLRGLFGQLIGFIRGLASKFGRAVVQGGRSVLGRLGGFFRRVGAWLSRLMARIGRRFGRGGAGRRLKRQQWRQFRRATRNLARRHRANGVTKQILKSDYRVIARSHRRGVLVTFITKSGPYWNLRAAPRLFPYMPRRIARTLLDRNRRWRAGKRAVLRAIRRYKLRPGNIDSAGIRRALRSVGRQYRYTGPPRVSFDQNRNVFSINWGMSPDGPVAKTAPEIDDYNEFSAPRPGRQTIVDNLVYREIGRSDPDGDPAHYDAVKVIKAAPTHSQAAYIKGHLISGFFGPGNTNNLTMISNRANGDMERKWETPIKDNLPRESTVRRKISRGNITDMRVYKMTVTASGRAGGEAPLRVVDGRTRRQRVDEETLLVRKIELNITRKKYSEASHRWILDRGKPLELGRTRKEDEVTNVPNMRNYADNRGFPRGIIRL